jgi:DNA-binding MarR family transcriptional regulator
MAPCCPADGCTERQQLRRDGVPLGWCKRHRAERLNIVPVGTVRPGPRGRGWRVRTATGWEACTEDGRPLRPGRAQRTDLAAIIERTATMAAPTQLAPLAPRRSRTARPGDLRGLQAVVLDALVCGRERTAHDIGHELHLLHTTVGKRLQELAEAGLVASSGRDRRRRSLWRITPVGMELVVARVAAIAS